MTKLGQLVFTMTEEFQRTALTLHWNMEDYYLSLQSLTKIPEPRNAKYPTGPFNPSLRNNIRRFILRVYSFILDTTGFAKHRMYLGNFLKLINDSWKLQ